MKNKKGKKENKKGKKENKKGKKKNFLLKIFKKLFVKVF